ncbi:hypothetical protein [Streptomyces griseoluteus]|uniref:hypothetical protein n=1 Tax=Streptomyces griseoluteus TaxID=29306 RepID=UPI00367AFF94
MRPVTLIPARAVLGVGGATLMPSTMAPLRTMFTDPARGAKPVGAAPALRGPGAGQP